MSSIVNRRDLDFILFELFATESLFSHEKFSSFDRTSVEGFLDSAQQIAERYYLPCAEELDAHEPEFRNGCAITHPSLKPALKSYSDAGFFAMGFAEEYGGLQAPLSVQVAVNGMFSSANLSAHNYALLTTAAANLLCEYGSDDQKARFLPPMLEGRWFGTMCLSEPQAGSSLSDISTLATPRSDGRYNIRGSKMWISGGEQDITENIVHMVLAKTPGAPPGVKGISLFIVPKNTVSTNGEVGASNNIALAGLNHKMGNRGTTNTLLNFGENGDCVGELVGEVNDGLRYMFNMMNEARINVGHGATMLGLAGYLCSLEYAKSRPQGRILGNKDPQSQQVEIIQHADVKRLLLSQKVFVEGANALIHYCAHLVDQISIATDSTERASLSQKLELLTPIAKSWPSEFCLEANKHAIQVLGGYGYTRDYPVERFYRDNRLNPIHEGTHAIQGIDLLGRKVRMNGGLAFAGLVDDILSSVSQISTGSELTELCEQLVHAVKTWTNTVDMITDHGDAARELANATLFLDASGHILIAWMWLLQANAAEKAIKSANSTDPFYSGKISAARFFFGYELPKALTQLKLVSTLPTTCMEINPEEFIGE